MLWDVIHALASDKGSALLAEAYSDLLLAEHSYNLGLLCCLPKKPSGHSADGSPYYTADHTRPLSIVNCDNRLVASAMRIRWEGVLDKWVSDFQRGFLPGRSMLSNVIDIDLNAMLVSLKHERRALVLFDVTVAFPSVSHEFIFATLRHVGFPPEVLNMISALYNQNHCQILLQGRIFDGFDMRSGIRQGCSLSPLIFVTVVDSLLRHLALSLPSSTPRAYADDTALIVNNLHTDLPIARNIFERFARISGLRLKFQKRSSSLSVIFPHTASRKTFKIGATHGQLFRLLDGACIWVLQRVLQKALTLGTNPRMP